MTKKKKTVVKLGYKPWIRRTVTDLREYLLLESWTIDIRYNCKLDAVASMEVLTGYMHAVLSLSPQVEEGFEEGQYDWLVDVIVHEFSHILTEPLYEVACKAINNASRDFLENIRERQTSHTSKLLVRQLPKRFYKAG